MKILIINTVALNVGDAAILRGELQILKKAFGEDTDFTMYDLSPEAASKYHPDLRFNRAIYYQGIDAFSLKKPHRLIRFLNRLRVQSALWWWTKKINFIASLLLFQEEITSFKDYESADLVISTGGTVLVENYFLAPRILECRTALAFKKPLIFFTQSLGPFNKSRNKNLFKKIFNESALALLRDTRSKNNLLDIGVDSKKLCVMPDAAFALVNLEAIEQAKNRTTLPENLKVAVSVRHWQYFQNVDPLKGQKRYQEAIKELVVYLVENYRASVTFVSTCQGMPEYYLDDSKVAMAIYKELPSNIKTCVDVNQDFHSPEEILEMLKDYDLTVATRLHMAILSLGAGTPVLPIAYEFKTKELFEKLGQERWITDIENIDSQTITENASHFLSSLPEIYGPLFEKVKKEKEELFNSVALIKDAIEKTKNYF